MAVKDLFNIIVNKAEAAEETAETLENVAEEAQGFVEGHKPPQAPEG
ncbi:MAG: hypothetical protein J6P98_06960 [Clostridia bacterium]|nr:hypothetical protein [Clostridia bacterium]